MIDIKEIERIAKLAKLKLSDQEKQNYSEQLSKALDYFKQISEVDTAGVEPLVTPTDIALVLRDDVVIKEVSENEILSCAPERIGNLYKVPPVV